MMNNYEWNQPDNLKRFSMFLSPKGTAPQRWAGSPPARERNFTDDVSQNLLSLTLPDPALRTSSLQLTELWQGSASNKAEKVLSFMGKSWSD